MKEVSCADVLGADPSVQIIDVRETDEVASGMIEGAEHLPMGQIPSRISELDPGRPVIAVCRSGARSASVADALTAAGFDCSTMRGGMVEWAAEGLPTSRG